MTTHDPQMLKGVLALLLLSLIDARTDYGYALVVRLREAGFEDLTEGAVYPALTRLVNGGYLEWELRPSSSGPARKYYRLTELGRQERRQLTESWQWLAANVRRVTGNTLDEQPIST